MRELWRVAVIDSGFAAIHELPARAPITVVGECRFVDTGRGVEREPTLPDRIGHGTAVTRAIGSRSPKGIELIVGQVMDDRGLATPAAVAAAICWATELQANLIHMSLGLREDRRVLADAVAAAVRMGCVLIASAPARGTTPFPAAYPSVIRATGDARCAQGEICALGTAQADFGGCPQYPGHAKSGGASIGAANVTGVVVSTLIPGSDTDSVRTQLSLMAHYHGAERKCS